MHKSLKNLSMSCVAILFGVASADASDYSLGEFWQFFSNPLDFGSWVPLLLLAIASLSGWLSVRSFLSPPATAEHVTRENEDTRLWIKNLLKRGIDEESKLPQKVMTDLVAHVPFPSRKVLSAIENVRVSLGKRAFRHKQGSHGQRLIEWMPNVGKFQKIQAGDVIMKIAGIPIFAPVSGKIIGATEKSETGKALVSIQIEADAISPTLPRYCENVYTELFDKFNYYLKSENFETYEQFKNQTFEAKLAYTRLDLAEWDMAVNVEGNSTVTLPEGLEDQVLNFDRPDRQ